MKHPDTAEMARAIQVAVQKTYTTRSTFLDEDEAWRAAIAVANLYAEANDHSDEYGMGSGTW